MTTALLVEDDPLTLDALDRWVQERRIGTRLATSLGDARRVLTTDRIDLAIVDVQLPDGDGLELGEEISEGTQVVFISGNPSFARAQRALRLGAVDFLSKPLDLDRLDRWFLAAGLARVAPPGRRTVLGSAGSAGTPEVPRIGPFVAASDAMRRACGLLEAVALQDEAVFVHGETGVGKELAARHVHAVSRRSEGPFEAVNCGVFSPSLIESELFGHERGSFTGADRSHKGVFERAHGGTLLLDEVTEMPPELQVKLLRVLETGTFARVGGKDQISVDVRIVAASNRVPSDAVAEGKLREDLMYRLYVLPVELPPLRAREDDVLHVARSFLRDWSAPGAPPKELSPEACRLLLGHTWPGNVRELKNVVRRAALVSGERIEAGDLCFLGGTATVDPYRIGVGMSLEEAQRRLLLGTLELHGGDKRKAAETLGVSLKTVYNRLHRYAGDAPSQDGA